jgi:transcriptional antiterminator NusG
MCYVIYTGAGREKTAQRMIFKLVPHELYSRVFYPFRHMRKKIGGNWADIYEWLIPGYLFVITDRPAELYTALRRVPRLTKLLGRIGDGSSREFTPVAPDEETWLRALLGDNWFDPASQLPADAANPTGSDADNDPAALAALSMIDFDEHDRVRILSGPLMTFSAQVRRIDLHRRFAEVEVNFMGHPQFLRLGLEILVKDKE